MTKELRNIYYMLRRIPSVLYYSSECIRSGGFSKHYIRYFIKSGHYRDNIRKSEHFDVPKLRLGTLGQRSANRDCPD